MRRARFVLSVLAALAWGFEPASAQALGGKEGASVEGRDAPPPFDTAATAPRPAPADALARFRDDPAFEYGRDLSGGPSLADLFWRWVRQTFIEPLYEHTSETLRDWALVLAAFGALAWAFSRVLTSGRSGLFARRDRTAAPDGPALLDVEEIADVDLDAPLARALADDRRRDAVRFHYLRALQRLAAREHVVWRKDKLNRDYLAEVRRAAPALAAPFAEATRLFEWAWYGDAPLDDAAWPAVRARLDRLDAALDEPVASAR